MTNLTIVGVGLIGGSLGLSLRRVRRNGKRLYRVTGFGRDAADLRVAKKRGAVDDFSTDVEKAVSQAELVVISVPVPRILPVLKQILPHLQAGAVVTDVGSVKKNIVDGAKAILKKRPDVFFVGAHPIAGSEKRGVRFASSDIFDGATCVVTKDGASFQALKKVKELWVSTGARCILMDAASHDRWLAMTSHLPHLLAFALFSQVSAAGKKDPVVSRLIGGSFRDMTRIAASDFDLWKGIIESNRGPIKSAVSGFLKELRSFIP